MREPNFIIVICWRKNRFSRRRIENYTTYASEAYYACEDAEEIFRSDNCYEFAILNVIKIRQLKFASTQNFCYNIIVKEKGTN